MPTLSYKRADSFSQAEGRRFEPGFPLQSMHCRGRLAARCARTRPPASPASLAGRRAAACMRPGPCSPPRACTRRRARRGCDAGAHRVRGRSPAGAHGRAVHAWCDPWLANPFAATCPCGERKARLDEHPEGVATTAAQAQVRTVGSERLGRRPTTPYNHAARPISTHAMGEVKNGIEQRFHEMVPALT
jgi:hypothetical protein